MKTLLAGIAVAIAFATSAPAEETPDFAATAHRVAIVSLLGDTIIAGAAGTIVSNLAAPIGAGT